MKNTTNCLSNEPYYTPVMQKLEIFTSVQISALRKLRAGRLGGPAGLRDNTSSYWDSSYRQEGSYEVKRRKEFDVGAVGRGILVQYEMSSTTS